MGGVKESSQKEMKGEMGEGGAGDGQSLYHEMRITGVYYKS